MDKKHLYHSQVMVINMKHKMYQKNTLVTIRD